MFLCVDLILIFKTINANAFNCNINKHLFHQQPESIVNEIPA